MPATILEPIRINKLWPSLFHLCLAGLQPPRSTGLELPGIQSTLGFGGIAESASSDPVLSSQSAARLTTLQEPQFPPWCRRRLLLDDLGWIPVVAIDQRPYPGRLRESGVGGGGVAVAGPSLAETRKQGRPGSRPCQSPADRHTASCTGRTQHAGLRHPSATASLRPAPLVATPLPFKRGAQLSVHVAVWGEIALCVG